MLMSYLKRHIKIIVYQCLFILVFSIVFSLYQLPVEAVGYASLLCLCVGAVLFAYGYWQYLRRHRALSEMLSGVTLSIDELPTPKGAIEQDYQNLIQALYADKARIVSQADSEKSDLIDYYTLWAHQIKTPIAAMRLLLQADENPQNAELSMELFKIEQYVEMVLQYLRLDSNSSDFVLKKYDLDNIVRQSVRKYAKLFILKKIGLDFKESGLTMLTDEKWLAFVIEQVLSNSLKYTGEGRITIYTQGMTLIIADTGIGIRGEDLPRVFEKGFTGYNGRADKKSTGIGLYLCKRILTKLGHTISIESEIGKGTRVSIGLDTVNLTVE